MSTQYKSPEGAILAGATLSPYLLVTALGVLCAVSATRNDVGITQESAASGQRVTIRKRGSYLSDKVVAAVAIAVGAAVYYDSAGRVGTTSASNTQVGIALTAATAAGDIIEVAFFG